MSGYFFTCFPETFLDIVYPGMYLPLNSSRDFFSLLKHIFYLILHVKPLRPMPTVIQIEKYATDIVGDL